MLLSPTLANGMGTVVSIDRNSSVDESIWSIANVSVFALTIVTSALFVDSSPIITVVDL